MLWTSMIVWLAGCPYSPEAACRKAVNTLCNHELECGISGNHRKCVDKYDELYYCDLEKEKVDYDTCIQDSLEASCLVSLPSTCGAILCDVNLGCGGSTNAGCCESDDNSADCCKNGLVEGCRESCPPPTGSGETGTTTP